MEFKVATRHCVDQEGERRSFHYYLAVDEVETPGFCCENYGVRVTEEGGETALVPAITTSAMRIDELLTLLTDNRVGPAGLADVVADWL